mmetsp:Transcript_17865/g.50319  ORF Transcript_17865/g.50319 Transcript_17865/m.50319 type:complete len:175 (+) Transcript_17865:40-564(+)
MGKGTVACAAITCQLLATIIFCVLPNVFWLYAGLTNRDNACLEVEDQPNLALYLILNGAVALLIGVFMFAQLTVMLCFALCNCKSCVILVGCVGFCASLAYAVFNLVWAIFGAVWLANDKACHEQSPFLYNSTLAAVIIAFVGMCLSCCSSGANRPNKKSEDDHDEEGYSQLKD